MAPRKLSRRKSATAGLKCRRFDRLAFELLEPRLLLAGDVLINEFMTINDSGLETRVRGSESHPWGNVLTPDWIELYNPGAADVDLDNWELRDEGHSWLFPPDTLIAAGDYMIVCASGLDITNPALDEHGYLHTDFSLTSGGEFLGLFDESDVLVHGYSPEYPRQLEEISYGVMYEEHGTTVLVDKGDAVKYHVPTAGPLDPTWMENGFVDDAWATGTTGLGFGLSVPGGTTTLVSAGSTWRYLDDGSDQGTDWYTTGFDDAAWSAGPAELGYGDGNEATVVSYGGNSSNKHVTTYFRRTFNVDNAWSITDLTLGLRRDDGAVVYLNGQELARSNMPVGAIDYVTFAGNDTGSETAFHEPAIDPGWQLVEGDNVLAVEIHQKSRTSSDISFDLELVADTSFDLIETIIPVNASALVRVPFTVTDPADFSDLELEVAYDDGYVAYLNGTRVAVKNAPDTPDWNSTALSDRDVEDAVQFEKVDLSDYLDLLQTGGNLLAIHAVNDDGAADGAFLICPKLTALEGVTVTQSYFTTPTPGAENIPGVLGAVADTEFSVDRGFFDAAFDVEITSDTAGAEIRYSLDGSAPTATTGIIYTGPINITTTSTLRAAAFKPGHLPTNVDTQTYIFPQDVAVQGDPGYPNDLWGYNNQMDYDVDPEIVGTPGSPNPVYYDQFIAGLSGPEAIPTLSLVLPVEDIFENGGLYANPGSTTMEKETSAEWIYPDGTTAFQLDVGLKMQGGASRNEGKAPKHSMSLRFRQQYGEGKLDYPLFDDSPPFNDSPVDSFNSLQLRAMYNNSWIHWDSGQRSRGSMIRDQWARDTLLDMGQEDAGRGSYVQLYINGLYWGVYNVHERQEASHYASYNGGDDDQLDALNSGSAIDGTTASWNALHTLVANAAADSNITLAEFQQIEQKLDIVNLIDYMIVNHYGGNSDWDGHNWRAAGGGPNDAPWRIYSWDAERILEGVTANKLGVNNSNKPSRLFQNLRNSDEFVQMFGDRIHKHFFNDGALTEENAAQRWMDRATELDKAIVGESARWGDYRRDVHSSSNGPYELYTKNDFWLPEQQRLMDHYFNQIGTGFSRSEVMIRNLPPTYDTAGQYYSAGLYPVVDAPVFNINGGYQHGGAFSPGNQLTMPAAAGTVYYTLDGTDPRPVGGGAPDPGDLYSGPVTLTQSAHAVARAYDGGKWSALNEAKFLVNTFPPLRLTEVMYNPPGPTLDEWNAGFGDNDDFEFIELQNVGAQPINLLEVQFTDGVEFTFPNEILDPGEYAVIVEDVAAFDERYDVAGNGINVVGQYSGALDNGGEQIVMQSAVDAVVHDFSYDDNWQDHTDGDGFSLNILDPDGELPLWNTASGWFGSSAVHGTPGAGDNGIAAGSVVINELLANSDLYPNDWIELHNTTSDTINVGGWFLSDNDADLAKYRIAPGTEILPGGYLVLTENENFGLTEAGLPTGDPGVNDPFALSGRGEDVYLSSSYAGQVSGYREHVDFGASPTGMTFGRHTNSVGQTDFTLLESPTYAGANAPPMVGPLVIEEVMYHPSDPTPGEIAAGFDSDEDFEFIELYNRSGAAIDLDEFYVSDAVGFTFGWYDTDDLGTAAWTFERGATATWTADLSADTYEVLVYVSADDGNGGLWDLDSDAQYEITHAGGATTVALDQDVLAGIWASLGSFAFDGGATPLTLTRGAQQPNERTIADRVKFVRTGEEVIADNSDPGFVTTGADLTTLAAGQSVVLVRNYEAFDERYDVEGNAIAVAGEYSGSLSNNGETIKVFQADTPEPISGYVPYIRIDKLTYDDSSPWPTEADGLGYSLVRQVVGDYASDPANWQASDTLGGTPGTPSVPPATATPATPDLVAASDRGQSDDDDVTNLDNSTPGNVLQFSVGGTIAGATVTIYAGDTEIGNAVAAGTTTVVATNGSDDLLDGSHSITARQTEPGKTESPDSAALSVTVDTQAPTASVPNLSAINDTGWADDDNITQGIAPQFTGTAGDDRSGLWKVEVNSDDGKSSTDAASPFYDVTLPTIDEGDRTVTAKVYDVAGNTFTTDGLGVEVDRTAPNVNGDVVNNATVNRSNVHTIAIEFDVPVRVSGVTALGMWNDTTDEEAVIGDAVLTSNDAIEVTWDLWATATSLLADGYHTATLAAAQATDRAGNPLAAVHEILFHRMLADLDGNARVNFGDFSNLAQNFDPLEGDPHRPGDVNGDGRVNFGDFSALASHFDPIGLPPRPPAGASVSLSMQRLSEAAVDQVLEEAAADDDEEFFDAIDGGEADAALLGVLEEL